MANKKENISKAVECIGKAAKNDAKIVVLPVEIYSCRIYVAVLIFIIQYSRNVSTPRMASNIFPITVRPYRTGKHAKHCPKQPKKMAFT